MFGEYLTQHEGIFKKQSGITKNFRILKKS